MHNKVLTKFGVSNKKDTGVFFRIHKKDYHFLKDHHFSQTQLT